MSAENPNSQIPGPSSVGDVLLSIANPEVDFAVSQLSAHSADRDNAVQERRKSMKRLRALVRLGLPVARGKARSIDRIPRDAGRILGPALDSAVGGTYADGAAGMHRYEEKDRDARAHQWRKYSRRLKNQLSVIEDLYPQSVASRRARLNSLAQVLGDHDDLTPLGVWLKGGGQQLPKKARSAIRRAAKTYQQALGTRSVSAPKLLSGTRRRSAVDCYAST